MEFETETLAADFAQALEDISDLTTLAEVERSFLGKSGQIRGLRRQLGQLDIDERRVMGAKVESLIRDAEKRVTELRRELEAARWAQQMESEWLDVTLASDLPGRGAMHPIRRLEERCIAILRTLGFEIAEGPEVESPYYNFDALNVPAEHPARDLQDTFWLDNGLLMRSHTTPIQARVLESRPELPLKVVARGRVYRNEAVDATHLAMFHQLEGFWVAENATLAELKHVLGVLVRGVFGHRAFRFKPKYYPYTEPSIGLDIACSSCGGAGCSTCHGIGWVTVIGAGMIHPAVLREFGYDPARTRGFAFGWGTSRLASQWLALDKAKDVYSNNLDDLRHHAEIADVTHVVG